MKEKLTSFLTTLRDRMPGIKSKAGGGAPAQDWKTKVANWESDTLVLRLRSKTKRIREKGIGFYGKIVTVLLSAFFLADALSIWLAQWIPSPPPTRAKMEAFQQTFPSQEDYNVIVTRNLFNSMGLIPGEKATMGSDDLAPVKTTLSINLLGTVVLQNTARSLATLEDSSTKTVHPLRAGDEIPGKLKALKIEPKRLIFFNLSNYRKEFVEVPEDTQITPQIVRTTVTSTGTSTSPDGKIKQVSETQFSVEGSAIDLALANFNLVLTQAKAVPNFENGVPSGFRLTQIVPGSIYSQLGLKENDILYGFNDDKINDVGKALEALNELKTARNISIQIRRGGKKSSLDYSINR